MASRYMATGYQTPCLFEKVVFKSLQGFLSEMRNYEKFTTESDLESAKDECLLYEDEVLPIHFIDQAAIIRKIVFNYTFRYDNVLDARQLHESLLQLVHTPGWRKIGGRLRANGEGKLEIHVPRVFTETRPAVRFSHVDHLNTNIDSHPLASRLPKATGSTPSLQEGSPAFKSFAAPVDLRKNTNHYLRSDEPLLCLHVTSFADATLVGLTYPHSLADAMGISELLKAWSNIIVGKSYLVKPLQGTYRDVLDSAGTDHDKEVSQREFALESKQTRGVALVSFIARYVWDIATRRTVQARHIYLPANYLRHLRQGVEQELKETHGGVVPFVSDGDLITAWGSRLVMSSRPWKRCSAVICNVFDIRRRLEDTFAAEGPYLQNLILPATTVLSRQEAADATTAQIAQHLRQAIAEQTSDMQTRSLLRLARNWFAALGTMPLFARWDSRVIACSNWTKAKFLDAADISSAASGDVGEHKPCTGVVGNSAADAAQDHVRPVMFWGTTMNADDKTRDAFMIYGKDESGNYWVQGFLRKESWALIEEEFRRFGKDSKESI
ncbi:BCL5p [Colletotrichum paranaense]|uniref:BCL5p n=1 Tax=Colletotrichum paranaense TaxID=1914294 RepID=A0ABQ9SD03_9PEZI|nr:BCL5p [Colletotrichum paranaense]KAK1533376.1 BCL5p [Colletotrichum paranaense]